MAEARPVGPGQRGTEPRGLREERAALLPVTAANRERRRAAGLVRQRPHRPAPTQPQQSAHQKQRYGTMFTLQGKMPWSEF